MSTGNGSNDDRQPQQHSNQKSDNVPNGADHSWQPVNYNLPGGSREPQGSWRGSQSWRGAQRSWRGHGGPRGGSRGQRGGYWGRPCDAIPSLKAAMTEVGISPCRVDQFVETLVDVSLRMTAVSNNAPIASSWTTGDSTAENLYRRKRAGNQVARNLRRLEKKRLKALEENKPPESSAANVVPPKPRQTSGANNDDKNLPGAPNKSDRRSDLVIKTEYQ